MSLKQWKCVTCNKYLATKSILKHHQIIHTGEKPFKCRNCGVRFKWVYNLRQHLYRKRKCNKPKIIQECIFCGKKISKLANYYLHLNCHTKERPYDCDRCGLSFTDPSCLRRHKTSHHSVFINKRRTHQNLNESYNSTKEKSNVPHLCKKAKRGTKPKKLEITKQIIMSSTAEDDENVESNNRLLPNDLIIISPCFVKLQRCQVPDARRNVTVGYKLHNPCREKFYIL